MNLKNAIKKWPILRNEKFKRWFKVMFMTRKRSYSQYGEDLLIYDFLRLWNGGGNIDNISYIDIGANDPRYISNTFLFYKLGYKGILIEANPELCKKAKKIRPRDRIMNIGVHTTVEEREKFLDFYIFKDNTLSTFSKDEMEHTNSLGFEMREVKKIKVANINALMKKLGVPTLLSIDVEGLDFEIIKTLDFEKYRPLLMVVETINYGISFNDSGWRRNDLINYIKAKDYVLYADTGLNSIFFDRRAKPIIG